MTRQAREHTSADRAPDVLPTEVGLRNALGIYGWRILGFCLTFAPAAALYVVARVMATFRDHPSPKTTLALAILTFVLVGAGCFGIGAWVNEHVARMPREVRLVVAPFIALAVAVGAIVALPLAIFGALSN